MASAAYVLTLALIQAYTYPSTALLVSTMASQDHIAELAMNTIDKCDEDPNCWTLGGSFTLQKLMSNKPAGRGCKARTVPEGGIAALSVPRTGSETLVSSITKGKHKTHLPGTVHDHLCTMPDLLELNAKRVAMSLRPPDERIVSAYAHGSSGFGKFAAPQGASDDAHNDAINTFFAALKDVEDPRHEEAMKAVGHEPFFLFPAAEFYLDNNHLQGHPPGVDFQVLCTCDLDEGLKALSSRWDFEYISTDIVSPHGQDNNFKPTINQTNMAWIQSLYKKDYALHKHWCARCA